MQVKELLPGDKVTEQGNHAAVDFEVVSINKIGPRFWVTFRSILGIASASYPGDAYIAASR
ncbi:hypothetical protein EV683_11856 [Crenobacter luteus]|uniref:Uncharacterized protein n=1 Tax=Crenobacter luteus TaxID=1452487 RepID=A0A165FB11_9NEIS|nr:hypothetical protein [Crenobacter luteus]KZE32669.1 hypothetical protein AVW16_09760 [Crenobacter luteus]TCP10858.1 hypothetical protein EV683_11856 [Crenobacter luteus]